MGTPSIRVLVVEDFGPWLRFISSELQKLSNLQAIGEVSDGEEQFGKPKNCNQT